MTIEKQQVEPLLSELAMIELENQRLLDDDSLRLITELRSRKLLTDEEWTRIKQFLREALAFLSGPNETLTRTTGGSTVLNPDFDPRNADWLRISAACRLAKHSLPTWAALWLWWLRTDTSPRFWQGVARAAEDLAYPKYLSEVAKPVGREVILKVGAEGGSVTLYGRRGPEGWRYSALTVDQTPMFLDEEDLDEPVIRKESGVAGSWETALRLMGRYPWHRFYPLAVHPEFRDLVWAAVQGRFGSDREPHQEHQLERWREMCSRQGA